MKYLFLFILLLQIPIHAQTIKSLPCEDSSASCIETLTAQAVGNSDAVRLLDDTIKLARRRGWTQYIDVSALNPLILSLQLIRNAAGGGERQKRKIEIKTLELAKADKIAQVRADISALLFALDSAKKRIEFNANLLEAHKKRLALYEISYAYGDGSTETMLSLWQTSDAIKQTFEAARTDFEETRRKLQTIVFPPESDGSLHTRNEARAAVIEDVERAWNLSGTTEQLNLIVLDADDKKRVYKSELLKIFPEGVKHLPDELQPREIYPTVKNGMQKVQYIGKIEKYGFNFVLFRVHVY